MTKPFGYIYMITHPDSERYYIGQARKPKKRWRKHYERARKGYSTPLYDWMRRYSTDFIFDIIDHAPSEHQLNDLEITYINLDDPNCLNVLEGGQSNFVAFGEESSMGRFTEEEAQWIYDNYHNGSYDTYSLASLLQCSTNTIGNIVKGISYPSPNRPECKLQDFEEARLRARMYREFASQHQDWSYNEIKRYFGIDPKHSLINKILKNKSSYDPNWDPDTWTFIDDVPYMGLDPQL